jgi:glutamate carboxypeptidase
MTTLPISLFQEITPSIESLIQELVEIESPSTEKSAVDQIGARIIREVKDLNGEIQIFEQEKNGNNIRARWGGGEGGILLLAHMDTVFDLGTLAVNPFQNREGHLTGPGVFDMKSSIALLLGALRLFQQQGIWPARPITALFTSDEETGSLTSRELIEAEARQAALVLTLEPALTSGALKTARKGTGDIEIHVKGVASHAGVDHAQGRNAIEELAHHILAAQRLTDYERGTTVNVGVISGGTRSNVVPDQAMAQIDFRVTMMDEFRRLEQWVKGLTPVIEGTSLRTMIDLNRPPMPRDATMIRTFEKAKAIAQEIGLALTEGSTGGGSDANFVAPLGIPVLDGLGPVGDGAHSEREYVLASSIPERTALLGALLLNW